MARGPDEDTRRPVTLALGGDVMTGRGIDQILRHPGDPTLRESYLKDARDYVELAEQANGPIPRPVDWSWVWGDALPVWEAMHPDAHILNLETSITRGGDFAPGKGVHYRMHPDNIDVLRRARADCLTLANNHVLDFGRPGLAETVATLRRVGLPTVGAGRDAAAARRPAVVDLGDRGRVVVTAFGAECSGVPPSWQARDDRPGIAFVPHLSAYPPEEVADLLPAKRPGDIVVASVHWGSNWGYDVPDAHRRVAHQLIDAGVDVVHGHSSHHPRPVEVYRDRLVLYGCGDLVDDYEGITGYEQFRDDLRLLYEVSLVPATGELLGLRMHALRARRMRLHHAPAADVTWLQQTLDRICRPYHTQVKSTVDSVLALSWEHSPHHGIGRRAA